MRKLKFVIIGTILAIFNFLIYTFLARVIFNSNELLWLDSIIAYILATFLAYFLHSRITWKDRHPTKTGIVGFFFWNFFTALLISPFFTWLFTLIKPLYEFIFSISLALSLPFDYNFIESTSVFCLTSLITMILNYLFYDRLVFNAPPKWLEKLTQKIYKKHSTKE
jgi:putative flippase GtrA